MCDLTAEVVDSYDNFHMGLVLYVGANHSKELNKLKLLWAKAGDGGFYIECPPGILDALYAVKRVLNLSDRPFGELYIRFRDIDVPEGKQRHTGLQSLGFLKEDDRARKVKSFGDNLSIYTRDYPNFGETIDRVPYGRKL
jgi:hypothetical protein